MQRRESFEESAIRKDETVPGLRISKSSASSETISIPVPSSFREARQKFCLLETMPFVRENRSALLIESRPRLISHGWEIRVQWLSVE